jgi:hypothetical protein
MNGESISEVLESLIGHVVTVINPHSYIPTITGYKIDAEAYGAKIVSINNGMMKVVTELLSDPHKNVKEKAVQFIPTGEIKGITLSKKSKIITI